MGDLSLSGAEEKPAEATEEGTDRLENRKEQSVSNRREEEPVRER